MNKLQANVNFLFLKKPSDNEKILTILRGIEIEYWSEIGHYIKYGNFTKFPWCRNFVGRYIFEVVCCKSPKNYVETVSFKFLFSFCKTSRSYGILRNVFSNIYQWKFFRYPHINPISPWAFLTDEPMGPFPHPLNIAGSTCNNAMKLCSLKEQSSVNILKQPKFRFRLHFFDDAINTTT